MEEVEVKILDVNEDELVNTLKTLHATFIKAVNQKDTMFTNKHIKQHNLKVRLRQEEKAAFFTIKSKPIVRDNMKVADEYEIPIIDPDQFHSLLLSIGLKEKFCKVVFRTYYKFHNCSIELIQHPNLPLYVELEGSKENILKVASLLGFVESDFFTTDIYTHYKVEEKTE